MSAGRRMTIRRWRTYRCRDCGVAQGKLHVEGCEYEDCPRCGGQWISCGCRERQVMRLPRVPFIWWPNLCALCGELNPEFFSVPATVWRHYVEPYQREKIVCEPCWNWLTEAIDHQAYAKRYGEPVSLWSREFRRRHGIPPDEPSPLDGTTEAEAPL